MFDDVIVDVGIIWWIWKKKGVKNFPPSNLIIMMKYTLKNLSIYRQSERRFADHSASPAEIVLISTGSIGFKNILTQLAIF